jgi:hypothetical protein
MDVFVHEQTTPASTWTIEHNLYTRAPIVDTYIMFEGTMQKILPKRVKSLDLNTLEIEWTVPRTGTARIA